MTATLDAAPQDVQILSFDFTTGVLELFNFGAEAVPLDGWRFCSHNGSSTREYTSPNGMNGLTVQPTMSLFIHYDGDSPPGGPDHRNTSELGSFATIRRDAYAISIYFAPVKFSNGQTMADHIQWSVDGADNTTADERTDEARTGGLWPNENDWISTTANTERITLTDDTGGLAHGPENYEVTEGEVVEPPLPRRAVQIREVDIAQGIVEIFNFSDVDIPLDGWSVCTHSDAESRLYTDETALAGVTLEAATSIFVHFNNDAPAEDADRFNAFALGEVAAGLDTGPYSINLYFPSEKGFIDFELPELIADHLQWSVDGVDDEQADERADEAVVTGLWSDENAWIATTADTTLIRLTDDTGGLLHSPDNYSVFDGGGGTPFHRGDTNDDGTLDLSDGVQVFNFLFLGGDMPTCMEAADANNSGDVDLTDGVAILNFLFQGGATPADPGPTNQPCGPDPDAPGSPGDLGCVAYNNC